MSQKELKRVEIMQKLVEKRMTQAAAADSLQISIRQVKRLLANYRQTGASGLISVRRGKSSNHKLPDNIKELSIALISEHYHDFGPTFAQEKLVEKHDLRVSINTLRKWMIESGIWIPRDQRRNKVHQPRYRRSCTGELIQIDGSDHDWFEGRGPRCTLLVYIDDATSKLMEIRFVSEESTFTYFETTKSYILKHGKPVAFYSDKYSVFRVNAKDAKGGDGITQFGRALTDLNIDIINAHTPQAKGRVERANKTLQDRLVKELRLQDISNMEDANAFAPEFMKDYNRRFGKIPLSENDVHRPLQDHERENLDNIFCWQEDRTLSNNLTLQYNKVMFLIQDSPETRKLAGKRVTVYDYHDGRIKVFYGAQELPYRFFDKLQRVDPNAIVENKRLGAVLAHIKEKQDLRDEQRSKSCPRRTSAMNLDDRFDIKYALRQGTSSVAC